MPITSRLPPQTTSTFPSLNGVQTATIRPLQVVRWPGAAPWRDGTSVCRPLVSPPSPLARTAEGSAQNHSGCSWPMACALQQPGCKIEFLWLPPAPGVANRKTSGTHETQQQAFSPCVQKRGPHTTRERPFLPNAGAVFPDGSACVSCPRVVGGLAAVPGGAAPRPPQCVCWGRSAPLPLLDEERRLAAAGDGACCGAAHGEAMWRETRRRERGSRVWSAADWAQRCRRGRNKSNRAQAQSQIEYG